MMCFVFFYAVRIYFVRLVFRIEPAPSIHFTKYGDYDKIKKIKDGKNA